MFLPELLKMNFLTFYGIVPPNTVNVTKYLPGNSLVQIQLHLWMFLEVLSELNLTLETDRNIINININNNNILADTC